LKKNLEYNLLLDEGDFKNKLDFSEFVTLKSGSE